MKIRDEIRFTCTQVRQALGIIRAEAGQLLDEIVEVWLILEEKPQAQPVEVEARR